MEPSSAHVSGIKRGWFFILLVAALLLGASWLVRWMAGNSSDFELPPPSLEETRGGERTKTIEGAMEGGDATDPLTQEQDQEPADMGPIPGNETEPEPASHPPEETESTSNPTPIPTEAASNHEEKLPGSVPQPLILGSITDAGLPLADGSVSYRLPLPSGARVRAVSDSRFAKLVESPFTAGKALYLLSLDSRYAFKYEGLASHENDLKEGQLIAAGTPLGAVSTEAEKYLASFTLLAIEEGDSWWQGAPVDITPYAERLCAAYQPNGE